VNWLSAIVGRSEGYRVLRISGYTIGSFSNVLDIIVPTTMSIKPGTCIGPYEVTSPLGEGGMGVVFRAHDTKLHRDVALKLLPEIRAVTNKVEDADLMASISTHGILTP
jgi:serine/threonine protein kinase